MAPQASVAVALTCLRSILTYALVEDEDSYRDLLGTVEGSVLPARLADLVADATPLGGGPRAELAAMATGFAAVHLSPGSRVVGERRGGGSGELPAPERPGRGAGAAPGKGGKGGGSSGPEGNGRSPDRDDAADLQTVLDQLAALVRVSMG
jgi:hypothetical protein